MTEQSTSTTEFDPMNLPTDEAGIIAYTQKLSDHVGDAEEVVPENADEDAAAKAAAETATKDAEVATKVEEPVKDVATTGDKTEEPAVVLTKDGKNTIPYSVLVSARERENEAKQRESEAKRLAEDASHRAKQLEQELADLKAGKQTESNKAATADLIASVEESMSKLESVPEVAEPLRAIVETVKSLQSRIDEQDAKAAQQREDDSKRSQESAAATVEEQINEAIDNNAVLRFWRDKDAAMYNRAADMDTVLRNDPANKNLSFGQRFEKVVAAIEAIHGKTALPADYQPAIAPSDTQARTEAKDLKPATAAAPAAKPMTLTDLPGGAPPKSADGDISSMSHMEIGSIVGRMIDKNMSPMDIIAALDKPVSV